MRISRPALSPLGFDGFCVVVDVVVVLAMSATGMRALHLPLARPACAAVLRAAFTRRAVLAGVTGGSARARRGVGWLRAHQQSSDRAEYYRAS